MAKGSFLSVKRGKLGDIVGYQVTNSKDKDKQGWRPYQPKVRNPQSDTQMVQRCKMAAVNNLYRALKSVITRGFENKKYGDESRRAWLKVALGQDFSTGPWMVRGSTQAVPIKNVPITVGSLPPVVCSSMEREGSGYVWANIHLADSPSTIADLSSAFINAGYMEGDQVTIIGAWVPARLAVSWVVRSFFINLQDSTPLSEYGLVVSPQTPDGAYFTIDGHAIDALGIAVSRDGDTLHLRSTCLMATNPITIDAVYYGQQMYEMAKESYINAATTRSTNWPIQPGGGTASGIFHATTISGVRVTLKAVDVVEGYLWVTDRDNSVYFVKGVNVASVTYNRYLTLKNAETMYGGWSNVAPGDATNANTLKFGMGDGSSSDRYRDEEFYNFLVSQGCSPLLLLDGLPIGD